MLHVILGLFEGSKCLMLSLGPLLGQNVSCSACAPRGVKMFHVKAGPLERPKCFM